jgi:nicotinamidase-related amidase
MPEVKINPEETAVLLIDMQNDLLHEKGKFAELDVWKERDTVLKREVPLCLKL